MSAKSQKPIANPMIRNGQPPEERVWVRPDKLGGAFISTQRHKGAKAHVAFCLQWRARSQAKFLPPEDLAWSFFCNVMVPDSKTAVASSRMIVRALNTQRTKVDKIMEYRIKPDRRAAA